MLKQTRYAHATEYVTPSPEVPVSESNQLSNIVAKKCRAEVVNNLYKSDRLVVLAIHLPRETLSAARQVRVGATGVGCEVRSVV